MEDAILIHSPEYANWIFDKSHPTQGRRFLHARNRLMLEAQNRGLNVWELPPEYPTTEDLQLVHDMEYVFDVTIRGESGEWDGQRHDLGDLAKLFVGGTLTALDYLVDGKTKLAINFAGAKHHAMRNHSSGFCVFADFAIAAKRAVEWGYRVAIFDVDAHHGDGTEELLRSDKNVLTYSVHEWGIFPGTGLTSDWMNKAFNYPLAAKSGDAQLTLATMNFLDEVRGFDPTIIFIAGGADGLKNDPLSNLEYTTQGYFDAMRLVREAYPDTPILLGGAGGYQPDTGTPDAWVASALGLMALPTSKVAPL